MPDENPRLRPSFARHRHAPARMDFRYVTGNLRRVYDYSLRDGDAAVTHTRARDTMTGSGNDDESEISEGESVSDAELGKMRRIRIHDVRRKSGRYF